MLKYKDGAEEREAESESRKRSCWGAYKEGNDHWDFEPILHFPPLYNQAESQVDIVNCHCKKVTKARCWDCVEDSTAAGGKKKNKTKKKHT